MKKLLSLVLAVVLSVSLISPVLSQKEPVIEVVSSFELFWPISAGKTMGESSYNLKTLKENIRGYLIFAKPQKAEYALFLATKRLVEAEKLLSDGKIDLAKKTLDKMSLQLKVALLNITSPSGSTGLNVNEINNKLNNLETFLPYLISKNEVVKDQLLSILEQVKEINGKI